MMRTTWRLLASAALVTMAAVDGAHAAIALDPASPTVEQAATATVTDADGNPAANVLLVAGHGPGSNVSWQDTVGYTDPQGRISWTPKEAGIAVLSAELPGDGGAVSQNVSVKFTGPPGSGVLVMIVAGLILYGGVVHGFTRLTRMVPDFPPDT